MSPQPVDDESRSTIRPANRSLSMALLRACETAARQYQPLLAAFDLTEQQWRVLCALDDHRSVTVDQVGLRALVVGPSLSRVLSALEERNLIIRTVATEDQRRSLVSLSTRGERIMAQLVPRSEAVHEAIEGWFGGERLSRLLAELDDLSSMPPITPGVDYRRDTPGVDNRRDELPS